LGNIPEEIRSNNWLDFASSVPVAFAQVREDSLIDQWIVRQIPAASRGIMIASGGCTAALLASENKLDCLTLVDTNRAQLELTRLKIAFLTDLDPSERLSLLGHACHTLKSEISGRLLSEELLRLQIGKDTFGPVKLVSKIGLDFVGRYELLFARLEYIISDSQSTEAMLRLSNPQEQIDFLKSNPAYVERLESAFSDVMALPNLVRLFGEEATQNAILPFSLHFLKRMRHAVETLPAASNPYLSQLLTGRFSNRTVYPWLEVPKKQIRTRMNYVQSTMARALYESAEKFDFIHLSNILDWLSRDDATALLALASQQLKKGGWLITRQLNSDLPIADLCQSLAWQQEIAERLHAQDRSFFYQKLHVARKA